ncbi:MAG: type I restriction-modification enzyme R subunit C-terminal domain-containing protein [Aeromonas veronii]
MQKGIEAEQRYLFDVQVYVAYTDDPMTREERAAQSEAMQDQEFDCRQLSFLSFVLDHYAKERVPSLMTPSWDHSSSSNTTTCWPVPVPSWGLLMLCAEPLSDSRSIYQGQ